MGIGVKIDSAVGQFSMQIYTGFNSSFSCRSKGTTTASYGVVCQRKSAISGTHDAALFILFKVTTSKQNVAHVVTAIAVCLDVGNTMNVNPCPFTMAEKLDTQNGMKKKRLTCHLPRLIGANGKPVVLKRRPNPIMLPIPSEVSHSLGDGSKYQAMVMLYQMK